MLLQLYTSQFYYYYFMDECGYFYYLLYILLKQHNLLLFLKNDEGKRLVVEENACINATSTCTLYLALTNKLAILAFRGNRALWCV